MCYAPEISDCKYYVPSSSVGACSKERKGMEAKMELNVQTIAENQFNLNNKNPAIQK